MYCFDVTPASQGSVSVDIGPNVAADAAGNGNTAATQITRTFDTSGPAASITPVAPNPRNASVASIQIVFNKAVVGFDLADLTLRLNGGANLLPGPGPATLTSSDNVTWTLNNLSAITGAEGTYVLKLTASTAGITDTAGNPLLGDATETWVMDTTAPTVAVVKEASQADPAIGPTASTVINFTVTFNESVKGFTPSGVHFDNSAGSALPTVANVTEDLSSSHKIYNVAVEGMSKSGFVRIDILAGAATDFAGNGNTASGSATVNYFKDDFSTL
jgi:hypothetical protein